jgi:hypothetical protein
MATLEEQFAALQGASKPSLEEQFAALQAVEPVATEPEPPTLEEIEAQRKAAQAEEDRKTFIERYGPPVAAGLQSFAATTLPFVGSQIEKLATSGTEAFTGVPLPERLRLREEHPVAAGIGTVGGLAAGVIATGGIGGAAEAAGAGAAELAAAGGAGRLAQATAAAKAAATVGSRAANIASLASPVAAAARLGAAIKAGATVFVPQVAALAPTVAAALAEGAALSTALEADEANLEGREMHGQAILNGALISGGLTGVLSGVPAAIGAFGETSAGRQLAKSLGNSAAERMLKRFGATVGEINRAKRQIGENRYFSVLNDAERLGLARPGMSADKSAQLAGDMIKDSGEAIGQFVNEAAARTTRAPNLAARTDDVLDRISNTVVKDLAANVEGQTVANAIARRLDTIREQYGARMSPKDLSKVRKEISETIYGLRGIKDPERTLESSALRDMRHILTDEISSGLERSGIDPKAWKVAQRQYEVASRIDDLAESAATRAQASQPIVDAFNKVTTLTGLKLLGKGLELAKAETIDWAPSALQRALESGVPKPMVRDLQNLADLRAKQLEQASDAAKAAAAMIRSPEEAARRQYLSLYNELDNAQQALASAPDLVSSEFDQYRSALAKAKKRMEDAYYGNIPRGTKLFHPAAQSPEFAKNAATVLESVEQSLTPYSRLGVGRTQSHSNAVQEVAAVRDRIRNALAESPAWGAEYNKAAIDRMNKAAATLVDPDRVAALKALEELTQELQSKSTQKTGELMGLSKKTVRRTLETERGRETLKKPLRAVIEMSGFGGGPAKTTFGERQVEPEAEGQ